MQPDLVFVPQVDLDLAFDETQVDIDADAGDEVAVEFAYLEAVDPDGDVGLEGVGVDSAGDLDGALGQLGERAGRSGVGLSGCTYYHGANAPFEVDNIVYVTRRTSPVCSRCSDCPENVGLRHVAIPGGVDGCIVGRIDTCRHHYSPRSFYVGDAFGRSFMRCLVAAKQLF